MPVRSRRIYGPTRQTVTAQTVVYTVPADRTLIVRSVVIHNTSSTTAAACTVHVNSTTSTGRLFRPVLQVNETVTLDEPFILDPGDTISLGNNLANALNVFIDGSLLNGAPS